MGNCKNFKLLTEIFTAFFRIGSFTFGGGYAMIPMIEREVAQKKKWVSEMEIVEVFTVAQSMPGAIAINSSTSIGYKVAGVPGAIVATAGVVLPAFLIITVIAMFFTKFQDEPAVKAVFSGIRPAIVGLIFSAAINMAKISIVDRTGLILALISVFFIVALDTPAILIVIGGALVGLAIYKYLPKVTAKILRGEGEH